MDIEKKKHKHILFVCTGNTCRSPMAAAIFNHFAEQAKQLDLFAVSAGMATESGLPVSPEAKDVLTELGINLEDHRSRQLDEKMIKNAYIVLTMTTTQRDLLHIYYPKTADKVFTLYEFIDEEGDITDPFGRDIDIYRDAAKKLVNAMPKVIQKLTEQSQL